MPAPNHRYSQRSEFQDDSSKERVSPSLDNAKASGLTISQVNLERKPNQAKANERTRLSLRQGNQS